MSAPTSIGFVDLAGLHATVEGELDACWKQVLGHGRFVAGPEVESFEHEFARYCGAAECVGVANGTDALELVLTGLGIGRGDEVILPANTFVATAEAVCHTGARPRFVDVCADTLLVDPQAVEAATNARTAAVIAVHLFGQMADVDGLDRIAGRHGLALVEDAAQAHGARYRGRRAGSVGIAAGFSFYPGKNLGALGDGGAVTARDPALAGTIRQLADHGHAAGDRHRHDRRGRNSRLDSLQAAVLSVKLASLDRQNARRRSIMDRYRANLPAGCTPVANRPGAESVHHLAVIQVDDRESACAHLDRAGIGWGVHYPVPCHRQPAFAEFAEPCPVAERAADRILSLPMHPGLTDPQVDEICAVLGRVSR